MTRVHEIRAEPLTAEAFAPFGRLIAARDDEPDYRAASGTRGWHVAFESGQPLLSVLKTPYRGLSFAKMERHFHVSQAFVRLGGSAAVVAVAPPSEDRASAPRLEDLHAFLLDGSTGLCASPRHLAQPRPLRAAAARHDVSDDHGPGDPA